MNRELDELRQRIREKTDEELLTMVNEEAEDYREEALEIARRELTKRGISESGEDNHAGSSPEEVSEALKSRARNCKDCGTALRYASLMASQEIVLSFHDNFEQRFLEIAVCPRCGHVSFLVDFETEVGA